MVFPPVKRKELLITGAVFLLLLLALPVRENHAGIAKINPENFISSPVSLSDLLDTGDEPMGNFQSITIPLKRAGRLFLIEATIDDQEGNLVFDTGSSGLVLNKTYFRKYTASEKPAG